MLKCGLHFGENMNIGIGDIFEKGALLLWASLAAFLTCDTILDSLDCMEDFMR